jgi:hypothetical protein
MGNENRNFQGQQKMEGVICFCRKHPIVLLRPFFIMTGLLIGASIGIFFVLSAPTIGSNFFLKVFLANLFTMMTITHHVFFLKLFHYFLDIVIVTNYRVIDLRKSVFLQDDKEIIDLHEIQDIKKNQDGILPNFLNYGDIKIATASLSTSMTLRTLPHPEYYLNQINQTKRDYILFRRHQKLNPELTLAHESSLSGAKTE